MADDKKTLKFQMMMSPSEADTLDNWMFKNRMKSRAEAIRRLCQMGIITSESPIMLYATQVLAHFIPPGTLEKKNFEEMKSGLTLEADIKRLCLAVIEQQSKVGAFRDKDVGEAIELAKTLTQDYKKAVKGTHLDPEMLKLKK